MEIKAETKNIRMSPRKVKIPVDIVRGMFVDEALSVLKYMPKKAAQHVYKTIASARANAMNNHGASSSEGLLIYSITVGEGTRLRRFKPGSRGNVLPIHRKNTHITVIVKDINSKGDVKAVKKTKAAAEKEDDKSTKEEKVKKESKKVKTENAKKVSKTKTKKAKS